MANVTIAIDPGMSGAIAIATDAPPHPTIKGLKPRIELHPLSDDPREVWKYFKPTLQHQWRVDPTREVYIVIEGQFPRPTEWEDKETGQVSSSILRSTCILYGNYQMLLGMLAVLESQLSTCTVEIVHPKTWQKALGMKRAKGEEQTRFKGRLRDTAHLHFPSEKVTLWNADALLLLVYAKMNRR